MAGALSVGGVELQPSSEQVALATNYITNFDFLNQYLPDTYDAEFARYGNRTVSGFLRMVGAELPSTSDLIKWAEQGRLHTKYVDIDTTAVATDDTATFVVNDTLVPGSGAIAIRVGQTVHISANDGSGSNKALVTAVDTGAGEFTVAYYEAGGQTFDAADTCSVFIYGSEFGKGTDGMDGSLEADDLILENKPIILKDNYAVNGSDMAQIGWVEVATENGASGYLWYMKSEHETRLRFDDYLETSMVEAVPAEVGSGAVATVDGTEGIFYSINDRGNVWSGGYPVSLSDWDTIVARLDKQGAIEENAIFNNRVMGFAIDDMIAEQNGGYSGGTSYGLFDNDKEMALTLGFVGFRRGYDFYKSDWKYLNDPTMRGGIGSGKVSGMLVPAGTTTVYDQVLGSNAKRPFLHIRYRTSQAEDRRYKTWITGSAGGARTSSLDAMEVNFLSERCVCVMGANNFVLFEG
jgi:hypothetical protein